MCITGTVGETFNEDNISSTTTETPFELDGENEVAQFQLYFSVVTIVTCVLIFCGNILVLLSVVRFPTLRTPTNMVLCGLALSDITVGITVMCTPIEMFGGYSSFQFNYIQCMFWLVIVMLPSLTTNFLLTGKLLL